MGFWEELVGFLFWKVHCGTEACGGPEPVLQCMTCGDEGKNSKNDRDTDSSSNNTASSDTYYPEEEDDFDVQFYPRGNEFHSDLSVISEERTLYTQRLHPTDSFILKQLRKGDEGEKK